VTKAERAGDAIANDFADLIKHSEETFKELWENEADEVWNDL
jgi:hypothetical protein